MAVEVMAVLALFLGHCQDGGWALIKGGRNRHIYPLWNGAIF
jgi:hypothetical protein